jgi:Flp pilus assembly protein TadG
VQPTCKAVQRGVAIVEFALILPLLLVMTFIVTEFGRALYQYNTIAKSVRDAARYLSVQTPGTHVTEARNLIVFGNIAGTGTPLALGLTTSLVPNPTWQPLGTGPVINVVTVKVSGYTFRPLFSDFFVSGVFGATFGSITYSDISATMRSPT